MMVTTVVIATPATDCAKLARSSFAGRCAILIYGFEDPSVNSSG
jgi:hypothetical protein